MNTLPALSRDTIAAIATPPGQGGIAVLRISGADALAVLSCVFSPGPGKALPDGLLTLTPRYLYYGNAFDEGGVCLDEVLAVYMPGPNSFTGEDVCEISCHGGMAVSAALLASVLAAGARLAEAGEFTRRAFLNGRMDLAQAEAVAEIIAAPSREGVRLAKAKLDGALGHVVQTVRRQLDAMRIEVTLCVDFPDEGAQLLPGSSFGLALADCRKAIAALLEAFERARLWREGAQVVLAGSVNAGKSSLLNALLGRPRAIVSSTPGTTRDYIEESVNIHGIPVRVVDTAGLRSGGDIVEEEGIRRTGDLVDEADFVLLVLDASREHCPEDRDFLCRCVERVKQGSLLIVCNKLDSPELAEGYGKPEEKAGQAGKLLWEAAFGDTQSALGVKEPPCLAVSARTGEGIDALCDALFTRLFGAHAQGGADNAGDIAPNLRQAGLLKQAGRELDALAAALDSRIPPDMLGVHLEEAAAALAGVTGASGTEELYDAIFSTFCIGK
ncbi:tRNA uridine-5-carboxymethylaminomethyl(34) synthesis GTPase MnmE [Desulfovibrio sp. OttesenSCG-928-G15]|nr:tRNA uridine-5-carboxymethylaminomethyl(34) synthesis GTPase MnmE [Desulfovibrio sp. OttesenSCG-928-G15]